MNTGLDQYMDIFKYGSHVEQTYRNAFGLKKSKCINWLKLNVSLAKRFFGKQGRWAIAIDPSYISKAGKKTPHIGRFWSGCAQSVKHGLEIMDIGLIDIDTKDCMMLRAHQSLSNKGLSLRNKTMVDFYIGVIKRYREELLKLSTLIVANAYFSTSTFVNGIQKEGFSLISRFRDAKGYTGLMDCQARDKWKLDFCFQCFVHITKCCQGNYEGDGNGIFYVFIQVSDDQHLSGETNF